MDDLRKQLDLDNKYVSTKKSIKKVSQKIKQKNWKRFARWAKILIPIIAVILINMALGGIFEHEAKQDYTVNLPESDVVEIKVENNSDPDTDGLTTKEELELGTNPFNRDTDGDGVTDDGEIALGLDPLKEDKDILIDAYNGINGNKYNLPVNYLDFVIRADSLKSRAYLTAISDNFHDIEEFTFNVSGTVEGEGYYKRKDGFYEKRNSGKGDGEIKVIRSDTLKDITTLKVFGKSIPIENSFLRGVLNFFLPKHGMIAAFDNLHYDSDTLIMNNLFSASNMEFAKETIENLSDNRFSLLHIDTSYKDRLKNRLSMGEIVPASIISQNKEYKIFITGEFSDGNFLAVDAKTKKEIGKLFLIKVSQSAGL